MYPGSLTTTTPWYLYSHMYVCPRIAVSRTSNFNGRFFSNYFRYQHDFFTVGKLQSFLNLWKSLHISIFSRNFSVSDFLWLPLMQQCIIRTVKNHAVPTSNFKRSFLRNYDRKNDAVFTITKLYIFRGKCKKLHVSNFKSKFSIGDCLWVPPAS